MWINDFWKKRCENVYKLRWSEVRGSEILSNWLISVRDQRECSEKSFPVLTTPSPGDLTALSPIQTKLFHKWIFVGKVSSCSKVASAIPILKKISNSSQKYSFEHVSLLPVVGKSLTVITKFFSRKSQSFVWHAIIRNTLSQSKLCYLSACHGR